MKDENWEVKRKKAAIQYFTFDLSLFTTGIRWSLILVFLTAKCVKLMVENFAKPLFCSISALSKFWNPHPDLSGLLFQNFSSRKRSGWPKALVFQSPLLLFSLIYMIFYEELKNQTSVWHLLYEIIKILMTDKNTEVQKFYVLEFWSEWFCKRSPLNNIVVSI